MVILCFAQFTTEDITVLCVCIDLSLIQDRNKNELSLALIQGRARIKPVRCKGGF